MYSSIAPNYEATEGTGLPQLFVPHHYRAARSVISASFRRRVLHPLFLGPSGCSVLSNAKSSALSECCTRAKLHINNMPNTEAPQDDDEIDLIHALQTAFSNSGDTELFLARASDQIRKVEATIIETCSKNRLRVDDNLYSLLESRDAIGEQTTDLSTATQTASEITTVVNSAVDALTAKITARRNLDAALSVAARTRRLTRMYARVEDTIDARRLHTALRMLRVLEEDSRSVEAHTVLTELVPDTRRLRTRVTNAAQQLLRTWLRTVRAFEDAVGSFALVHAQEQAVARQALVDSPRGALGEPFAVLPLLPPAPAKSRGNPARPWSPLLTINSMPSSTGRRRRGNRSSVASLGAVGGVTATAGVGSSGGAVFGREAVAAAAAASNGPAAFVGGRERRARVVMDEGMGEDVPELYLRPLLQALHVGEGLQLVAEMRAEYRKERLLHLQNVLNGLERRCGGRREAGAGCREGRVDGGGSSGVLRDSDGRDSGIGATEKNIDVDPLHEDRRPEKEGSERPNVGSSRNGGASAGVDGTKRDNNDVDEDEDEGGDGEDESKAGDTEVSSERLKNMSRAERIEALVFKVVGFFIVERAVELQASCTMVAREVVDGEWWSLAYAKLLAVFKEYEESGLESGEDKARVRDLEENLERFAEVNGLIK